MAALPKADIILRNGKIFRSLASGYCSALAIWSGKVLAVGSDAEIDVLRGPETRVIDLAGRLATPGLYDSHMHLLPYGLIMGHVDIRPAATPTLEALLGALRKRVEASRPGEWIFARGYDQFELDVKRHPLREELDAIAPDNPVYITRACGHVCIANSMALSMAGIDESTPVPQGGAIEQQNGRLTGLLAETGRDRMKAVIPAPDDEELIASIERAGKACLAYGFTSVMDAGVGMRGGYREVVAYRRAQASGRLPLRVEQCLLGGPGGIVEECWASGVMAGQGDDHLRVGPVKIFTDGSAGGKTAAMSQPYLGEPENYGLLLLTDAEMDAHVRDYHAKGYQLAVHAIGDAAIEQTLNAFEKALIEMPDPNRRHRIEHCGYNTPEQIARMKRLGVEPVPQQVFIHDFGDLYRAVLGPERADRSYPLKTWIDAGMKPGGGSDAPVCDINPFPNIYSMLTRKTQHGTVMAPEERVSIEEALACFTEFSAYVNKCENHRGRLDPGMAADVAIFSHDMTAVSPETIRDEVRCDMTILGGAIVYQV